MRTELPAERLRRRLSPDSGGEPDEGLNPDDGSGIADPGGASDEDPNSLLPCWLPDGSANGGWLAGVRADPGRAGAVALAVVAALAVLVTVFTVIRDRPSPVVSAKLPPVEMVSAASTTGPDPEPVAGQPVVVSVVGLVHRPGLTTLTPGARIADALDAAGGALDGADTTGLNMARQLVDGEQIVVGIAPPRGQPAVLGSSVTGGSDGPAGPSAAAGPPRGPEPAKPAVGPINLNTATVQQLDALPGIGPVTAAAIVAWRETHGKFGTVDQLGEVDGIGPARLERLRALVRV
ncbi:MAG TPA: ComEA family DNA-binding protein [Mycobacterium sp.]|nr:ComEA family DNA-binding protein [Mycobacterium sp.]